VGRNVAFIAEQFHEADRWRVERPNRTLARLVGNPSRCPWSGGFRIARYDGATSPCRRSSCTSTGTSCAPCHAIPWHPPDGARLDVAFLSVVPAGAAAAGPQEPGFAQSCAGADHDAQKRWPMRVRIFKSSFERLSRGCQPLGRCCTRCNSAALLNPGEPACHLSLLALYDRGRDACAPCRRLAEYFEERQRERALPARRRGAAGGWRRLAWAQPVMRRPAAGAAAASSAAFACGNRSISSFERSRVLRGFCTSRWHSFHRQRLCRRNASQDARSSSNPLHTAMDRIVHGPASPLAVSPHLRERGLWNLFSAPFL